MARNGRKRPPNGAGDPGHSLVGHTGLDPHPLATRRKLPQHLQNVLVGGGRWGRGRREKESSSIAVWPKAFYDRYDSCDANQGCRPVEACRKSKAVRHLPEGEPRPPRRECSRHHTRLVACKCLPRARGVLILSASFELRHTASTHA